MSERFFVDQPITGDRAQLMGDEARHLIAVMRAKAGDEVMLFDGSGAEFVARVEKIGKNSVELAIAEHREISRELRASLTLAVALPKGERQKWLVEKVTEIGVTKLIPLITERSVAQPVASATDRLRRTVIEASKQCGRNRLMEIAPAVKAVDLFAAEGLASSRLVADPSGEAIASATRGGPVSIVAAIGAEGGFTDHELAAARAAGWQSVSLGPRTLRVETAAVAIAACLAARDQ